MHVDASNSCQALSAVLQYHHGTILMSFQHGDNCTHIVIHFKHLFTSASSHKFLVHIT